MKDNKSGVGYHGNACISQAKSNKLEQSGNKSLKRRMSWGLEPDLKDVYHLYQNMRVVVPRPESFEEE